MAINPTIYVMFECLTLMNVRVLLKKNLTIMFKLRIQCTAYKLVT